MASGLQHEKMPGKWVSTEVINSLSEVKPIFSQSDIGSEGSIFSPSAHRAVRTVTTRFPVSERLKTYNRDWEPFIYKGLILNINFHQKSQLVDIKQYFLKIFQQNRRPFQTGGR